MPLEHQFHHLYMVLLEINTTAVRNEEFTQLDLYIAYVKSKMLYPLPTVNVISLKMVMST